jgi:hypothetical protein
VTAAQSIKTESTVQYAIQQPNYPEHGRKSDRIRYKHVEQPSEPAGSKKGIAFKPNLESGLSKVLEKQTQHVVNCLTSA